MKEDHRRLRPEGVKQSGHIRIHYESHRGRDTFQSDIFRGRQVSQFERITPFDINASHLSCVSYTVNAPSTHNGQQIVIFRLDPWLPATITIIFVLVYCHLIVSFICRSVAEKRTTFHINGFE